MSTYAKYADKYKNRLRTRSSELPNRSSFPSSLPGPSSNILIQQGQSPLHNISHTINNLSYRQNNSSLSPAATAATKTFIGSQTTPPRKLPPKPMENRLSTSSTSLMVDRNAYMSYLEVQLDKVSSACLTVQGFAERVQQLQSQINTHEDKIINMARLVKLQQSYSNGQEEEMRMIQEDLANVLTTQGSNDKSASPKEMQKLRRSQNNQKVFSSYSRNNQRGRSNSQGKTQNGKTIEALIKRIQVLQSRNALDQIRKPLKPVVPMGKQEAIQAQNILWREQIQRNLNEVVTQQGRDMSRDVTGLEQRLRKFENEMEYVKNQIKKSELQNSQQNFLGNSQNELRFSLSRGKNNKKENNKSQEYVERMLHQWGSTIETQVNEITDKINNSRKDNLTLNKKINDIIEKRNDQISDLRQIAEGAEQLCNRLADDSLKKSNALESKLNVIQGRILKKLRNQRKSSSNLQQSDQEGSRQRKISQGSRTSKSPSAKGVTINRVREEIRLCEEVLTQKITNAVQKLGGLLKKYVKDQKRLTSRIDHIDTTTAANTTSTSFAKKTISSNLKATTKNYQPDKNRKIPAIQQRSNRSVKQASVNSSMQFKPMNRQKISQLKQTKSKPQSRLGRQKDSQTNNFSSQQNNNKYYTDDQKPDALDLRQQQKVPFYPDMELFSDPYDQQRSRSPTLGEVQQNEEQFEQFDDSSLDGIVKNSIKKRESVSQSLRKNNLSNQRDLSDQKFQNNREQFSALSPQTFNLRHKFRQNSSLRKKTPEQDRNVIKKRRKNSNISDVSNKSAKRDQRSKKKIMKAIGRDLEKKTRYERTGEVRRTMAKSKSTSNTRRPQKLYGIEATTGFTSQSYQDISPDASPMRRNKFMKVRPQSAKNAYQSRLKFRFSPYQTERSKVRELAARVKKQKSVREKLMDDIVDFQKEMKGKNRHSAVNLEINQDDTPKFKDAYKDYLGGEISNKGKISSSKKDQVMQKLNKKLKQLQQPLTKCEKQKFR